MLKNVLSVLVAAMTIGFAFDASAKRVALVIGNDAYTEVPTLQKAVNDARAIAETLGEVGFDVTRAENLTRREMNEQLQQFTSRLEVGDEAVFFYAGHGVEIEGRNYLLPTDIPNVRPGQEDLIKDEAFAVDRVLDRITSRGTRVSVLVLDACRNNPFLTAGTRSLGGTRGLARIDAPEGTFIMYSAGVGQSALDRLSDDDPHPNSVFTRSLIPLLKRPNTSLIQMARQVRRDVQALASKVSHDQRPAYYDEVTGDFFFAGKSEGSSPATSLDTAAPSPADPAAQAWAAVKDSNAEAVLEAFVKQFPGGVYAELAKARLADLKRQNEDPTVTAALEDPATRPAIGFSPDVRDGERLTAANEIKEAQTLLYELNYDPGPADGQLGRRTAQAIRDFQSDINLSSNGTLTRGLVKRLRSAGDLGPWGAIVYAPSSSYWGMAWSEVSRAHAVESAQKSCDGACDKELTFFSGWCGAFAHATSGWALSSRTSAAEARTQAMTSCGKQAANCEILAAVCADGADQYVLAD